MELKYKKILGSLGRRVIILMNPCFSNKNRLGCYRSGMTSLELLLAISMLVLFTGVVAVVMQFTLRFFKASEPGARDALGASKGVLIDHGQLNIAMDAMVEVLSQPGVSMEDIAFDKGDGLDKACTDDPINKWASFQPGLAMMLDRDKINNLLPSGYHLCLLKTEGIRQETAFTPSLYLLLALPKQVSESSLPARRFFCRPRPYC